MPEFYDLGLRETSEEMQQLAEELGWAATSCDLNTVFLEADDWGELKQKINDSREDADILIFKGGNEKLNRKAAEDTRIDILLHPEKGRKDSGIDHVIAEEAAESRVAVGFDLQQLLCSRKNQTHILNKWRRNLKLCRKYDTPYLITSGGSSKLDLRAPRELVALIESIGFNGLSAVSECPRDIVERLRQADKEELIRPGEEVNDE